MEQRLVALVVGVLFISLPSLTRAQVANVTLTGTIADASGRVVPNARVSVKNVTTGQLAEAQSDSSGHFSVSNLVSGDYEISAAAPELGSIAEKVTLTTASQNIDLRLNAGKSQQSSPAANNPTNPSPNNQSSGNQSSDNLPNAPSSSPSLSDLGFTPEQTQGNTKEQALLDKRTHMLKIHQRMGLITTIPLLAAILSSPGAGGKSDSTTGRNVHLALGAVAGDLYFITAYYAIRAPRVPGTEVRGPIRLHKALAWVHGPGMILTPILGALAYDQKSNGEKVHGIASAHMPVAIVTAGAFGAALLSVSVKF